MEQFRQIGEVVGSLNALMIFQNHMLNQKQCSLLVDMLSSAYHGIADLMKKDLKFEEKATKWKITENPLRELLRVFREGESYVRLCLDVKDFWAKSILLHRNSDCLEFHVHNLLATLPIAVEAVEMAGQISGSDPDEMHGKRLVYSAKYHRDMREPRIFQWVFGAQYLVPHDTCTRIDSARDEDRWHLLEKIKDIIKKSSCNKRDHRLADVLLNSDILLPSATLVGSKDYQVRRRLGNGSQYKEIQWLGESFALRHFFGDIDALVPEVSTELSLSHPNVLHTLCAFADEEKKECFLVTELMSKDLSGYIKEICGPRKRVPFSLPVAVDLMLQIARGMEYLHSKKICHGELNPTNVLVKARMEGYLHAKVSGFGLSSSKTTTSFIWYAPEVLSEQEGFFENGGVASKVTEKGDVYSFGMICFELLTGKVPFEDTHLQGDKTGGRNIRAGERPLFPFHSPKYVTSLTKKCWHADPAQRPSFSAICRILRYTRRFLAMNPELGQPDVVAMPMPPVDFSELEGGVVGRGGDSVGAVYTVPFEMFAYRVTERERGSVKDRDVITSESGSDGASTCDEKADDTTCNSSSPPPTNEKKLSSEAMIRRLTLSTKRTLEIKAAGKQPGTPKGRSSSTVRPPHTPGGRTMRMMNSEGQLVSMSMSPKTRRRSGHASDSELP